jgi:hypothetical protein
MIHLVTISKGSRTFHHAYKNKSDAACHCQFFADMFDVEYNNDTNTFQGKTFGGVACSGFLTGIEIKKEWIVPDQESIDFMLRI